MLFNRRNIIIRHESRDELSGEWQCVQDLGGYRSERFSSCSKFSASKQARFQVSVGNVPTQ